MVKKGLRKLSGSQEDKLLRLIVDEQDDEHDEQDDEQDDSLLCEGPISEIIKFLEIDDLIKLGSLSKTWQMLHPLLKSNSFNFRGVSQEDHRYLPLLRAMEARLGPQATNFRYLSIDLTGLEYDEQLLTIVQGIIINSIQFLENLKLLMDHNDISNLDTLPKLKKLHLVGMWDINSLPKMPILFELILDNCTLDNLVIRDFEKIEIVKILGCNFTTITLNLKGLRNFQFKLGRHRKDGYLKVDMDGPIEKMIIDCYSPPYGQDNTLFKGFEMSLNIKMKIELLVIDLHYGYEEIMRVTPTLVTLISNSTLLKVTKSTVKIMKELWEKWSQAWTDETLSSLSKADILSGPEPKDEEIKFLKSLTEKEDMGDGNHDNP